MQLETIIPIFQKVTSGVFSAIFGDNNYMTLNFEGFIKDVQYKAFLTEELSEYSFSDFDINNVSTSGKVILPHGEFAYSKWVSPKRTRSYPFERLYNTFNSPMRLTVIPILKDEGLDGDLDRIQYSTISWMNLLNVYIVLAYYDRAVKNNRPLQILRNKITNQEFNVTTVNDQIAIISQYKQSALHWNRTLIEDSFVEIYRKALDSYENISKSTGVRVHNRNLQEQYLATVMRDFLNFRDISLRGSRGASVREIQTSHGYEYLSDGLKATFEINNYLGGTYYLTADEVVQEGNIYVIQEAKNSTKGFLPGLSDIKDGLFKLILFSNLHTLKLDTVPVEFRSRLKLTGNKVRGVLSMPCDDSVLDRFFEQNRGMCTAREIVITRKMNQEASNNPKLEILISSNK